MRRGEAEWPGRGRPATRARARAASLLLSVAGLHLGACVTAAGAGPAGTGRRELEAESGIRVEALRLSAAGYILDFRYRVIDAEKVGTLLDGKQRPYLLDERGAKLGVPDTPILGSLRQTSRNGKVSTTHTYFVLFANPGKYLRAGDRVTLVVGDARLPGLTVE